MNKLLIFAAAAALSALSANAKDPVDWVNPFIGTTNYGTANPGALVPNGLMSVTPFNVMGSDLNRFDKDSRWWSTPYDFTNKYITGFSHVNLSGVGCPELGSLLVMATTGKLNVDYHEYGTTYSNEKATPGFYSVNFDKYGIEAEATATARTSRIRYRFPAGTGNILLNLGEGLTNETGATVRRISDTEVAGTKLLGTFCYNPEDVFPIYFVMRVSKKPESQGYWKFQRPTGVEAQWDADNGKYKIYRNYSKQISGDDIGVWYTYNTTPGEEIEVSIGVSFVSEENARLNLDAEQPAGTTFTDIKNTAREAWNNDLGRILVEGGTDEQKTVFYTALYHSLIHPNILQDVNGEYPAMESDAIMKTDGNRYTVYSLWDTYRNLHQLLTLVYPDRQTDMINSMLGMYKEHGWLPKWELYGRETLTMEGDPSIPVIADSYLRGLRGFDIDLAYEAMKKGATTPGKDNLMRPDADDYFNLGFVPLREQYDNSVSHALEYYTADYALSKLAGALGKKDDAKLFGDRSLGYKHYFDKETNALRPLLPDGSFLNPFNPRQGENFEPSPGFHEGNSWNYTFAVPHDVKGLARLMGGDKKFVKNLQAVFDNGLYDPANEPDIIYPYLFSRFKGEEWRTQKIVSELLNKYFTANPNGIPGNDDCGTMSTWAIFSMMGIYPDTPGEPYFTVTTPVFDRVTVKLDPEVWGRDSLTIEVTNPESESNIIKKVTLDGKPAGYRISHEDLIKGGNLKFTKK